jgi:glutamate-1-semialdehyde 2,1-aminomutase
LYNVQPDLATYGKIMGGGMPVAAVAGRSEIMELVSRQSGSQVRFSGGTYSAHPASLLAAKTLMTYLVEHESEIYPRLAALGEQTRHVLLDALRQEGIYAQCTGGGNEVISGSSMFMLHFPFREDTQLEKPADWFDPALCDVTLSRKVLDLALLLEDVFILHSHGSISASHTESDIESLALACQRAARRIKPYL